MTEEIKNAIYDANPNGAVRFEDDQRLQTIIEGIAEAINSTDKTIEDLRSEFTIAEASAESLNRLGRAIGVRRRDEESIEAFRTRVRAAYASAISDTTIESFGSATLLILDTDESQVDLRAPSVAEPAINLKFDIDLIDETTLTEEEIINLLDGSIAASHTVRINSIGTFRFDGEGFTPGENSGFNEGTLGSLIR